MDKIFVNLNLYYQTCCKLKTSAYEHGKSRIIPTFENIDFSSSWLIFLSFISSRKIALQPHFQSPITWHNLWRQKNVYVIYDIKKCLKSLECQQWYIIHDVRVVLSSHWSMYHPIRACQKCMCVNKTQACSNKTC